MRRMLGWSLLPLLTACVGDPAQPVTVSKDASADQTSPSDGGAESSTDAAPFDPTWTLPFGSKSNLTSVVVDPNGDVYVAGTISEAFTLGTVNLGNAGGDDGFLMKLDGKTKQPVWAKTIAGPGDDSISSIAFDSGALYAVGGTTGAQVTAGATVLTIPTSNNSPNATRSFFAKLDPSNGAPVWLASPDFGRNQNQTFSSACPSIAVSAKKIVIGCTYFGPNFGYGVTAAAPLNNGSSTALAVLAFNDGQTPNPTWTKSLEGNGGALTVLPSIAFDSNHDVWLAATLRGMVFLDDLDTSTNVFAGTGASNPFVLKLAGATGQISTSKFWPGGSSGPLPSASRALAISGTDVFIGGMFITSLGLDTPVMSKGGLDGFAARLDSTMGLSGKWQFAFGGAQSDSVTAVAPSGDGGAYLALGWGSSGLMFGSTTLPTPLPMVYDTAIASIDAAGMQRTALPIDSTNGAHYGGLVVNNYVYGVGGFSGSATFDDGTKSTGVLSGNTGFFVRRPKF